jgi:hypothetical protein
MTKVNFAASREKAEEAGLLGGGGYYNKTLRNGDNRFRLVSECLEHPGSYNGKPTFKWLCLVLDRADGAVKPYFMPNTVYEEIEALQMNPDYTFDEVPMPYDLTLNIKGVKTKDVVYKIIPARTSTPLTPEELNAIKDAGLVREVQQEFQRADAERATGTPQEPTITVHEDVPPPQEPPMPSRSTPPGPRPWEGRKPGTYSQDGDGGPF